MGHDGCKGAGDPCPVCNPAASEAAFPQPPAGFQADVADHQVDDLVAAIYERWLAEQQHEDRGSPDQFFIAELHQFAADIVAELLPHDPVAQQAVIRKAMAFGINVDDAAGPKGDKIVDRLRRRT
jgi:hypothetical protein